MRSSAAAGPARVSAALVLRRKSHGTGQSTVEAGRSDQTSVWAPAKCGPVKMSRTVARKSGSVLSCAQKSTELFTSARDGHILGDESGDAGCGRGRSPEERCCSEACLRRSSEVVAKFESVARATRSERPSVDVVPTARGRGWRTSSPSLILARDRRRVVGRVSWSKPCVVANLRRRDCGLRMFVVRPKSARRRPGTLGGGAIGRDRR